MKALLAILLALGALIGGAFLYFGAEKPVAVSAAVVERADIADVLVTNGRIEAGNPFDVYAETSGRVLRVAVDVGDVIQKGALIAAIDDRSARAELAKAQAVLDSARAEIAVYDVGPSDEERAELKSQIAAAEAQRRELRSDLEVAQRLIEKGATPQSEARELERRLEALDRDLARLQQKLFRKPPTEGRERLQARAREAEAGVELARRRLGSAQVRSPIAGTVYALAVRPGDFVSPGALVARIAGSSDVQAVLFIDEPELGRVELNRQATLTADAYPGQSWTCAIEKLPTEVVALETRRVGEVRCRVAGEAQRLIPNLTVSARIPSASAAGVASLPREAVQGAGDEQWVWTMDADGRAQRTRIETGVRGDARIEVRSGLELGEVVLLPGAEALEEGRSVEASE